MEGMLMYRIVLESGEVLASQLTLAGVDDWWGRYEKRYFSLRNVGMTLYVAPVCNQAIAA